MKEYEVKEKENFFEDDTEEHENVTPLVDICDTHPFVSECIDMLATGAAPGPDGIPAAMIKGGKSAFASMLSNIMRTTIDSGNIPSILKTAYVLVHSQSYISPRKPKYPKTFY